MSVISAMCQVLKEADRPLSPREITAALLSQGLWTTDGKTPEATVSARLYSDIKTKGDQSAFVKIAPNLFSLNNSLPVANSVMTEPAPKAGIPEGKQKTCFSFLDSAEKVLDEFGNGAPMHYREITRKALELGWLATAGKTPEATMNAQIVTELKRSRGSGEPGRFLRSAPGFYSLTKSKDTGLPYQISSNNREVRKKLLSRLMTLTPGQFEELVGQLLAEMGFDSIEVTRYGGDGGIDVRGTLLIGDAVRIKMAVQAKRWKNNVQSPTVQQVRGSLGAHEQGLIITTSGFSPGAVKEANQPDKTPVGLINGEQLVNLLMEYNIGVRRTSYDLFELEESGESKGEVGEKEG